MKRATSSPEGQRAIGRLRLLLKKVDRAFGDPSDFYFPQELKELPDAIQTVLPFLRRKNAHPFPFWKALQAVNTELPALHLERRLAKMVDRATSGPIGPLRQLFAMAENKSISVEERRLLPILEKQIGNGTPTQRQLNEFAGLITKVPLPLYDEVQRSYANFAGIERDLLNRLAYCSFLVEHYRWKLKYFRPLCTLFDFLFVLENDELMSRLKRVLMSEAWPSVKWEIEDNRKFNARLAQWRHRNKDRRLRGKLEKVIPEFRTIVYPREDLLYMTLNAIEPY